MVCFSWDTGRDSKWQWTTVHIGKFKDFGKHDKIKHTLVTPYHPQSNELEEKGLHAVSQESTEKASLVGRKWSLQQRHANILLRYRVPPHSAAGKTTAELFLKYQLRYWLSCINPNQQDHVEWKQQKMKEKHDGEDFKLRDFQKEDLVKVTKMEMANS